MPIWLEGPVFLVGGQDFNRVYVDWPANDANVYAVDTGDTLVLIDCGCGDSLPGILENVEELDFRIDEISHLLLTHAHFPHAAAAEALQKMGVEVVASPPAARAVMDGGVATAAFWYGRRFTPCETEITTIEDGDSLDVGVASLRAIALPGHSPGSMGYELTIDSHRLFFSGDVVRHPNLKSLRARPGYSRRKSQESLLKLLEESPEIIYPGHGPFCLSRGRVWVQKELRKLLSSDANTKE